MDKANRIDREDRRWEVEGDKITWTIPKTDTQSVASRYTSAMGRCVWYRHAVKINDTIAIYLVSHDNKR